MGNVGRTGNPTSPIFVIIQIKQRVLNKKCTFARVVLTMTYGFYSQQRVTVPAVLQFLRRGTERGRQRLTFFTADS
jgi:hypothetical protein